MLIACNLQGANPEEIVPFPGTEEALQEGCACPKQGKENILYFESECPIHVLEKVKAN